MKKFTFRLRKLEDSKRYLEKQKALQLAEKIRLLEFEKQKLMALIEQKEALQREMKSRSAFKALEMIHFWQFLGKLRRTIAEQKKQLGEVEKAVEVVREELMKISQEKKVLEKLHEKNYQAYLKESNREDQKFVDEIATQSGTREKWKI